jgi:hypothetical protein
MQHEFNNRITAQRSILQVLNRKQWDAEDLFGLSAKAIDRWVSVNRIDPGSNLVKLVRDAAAKLFFLANKSQEQISEEYRSAADAIAALRDAIALEIDRIVVELSARR